MAMAMLVSPIVPMNMKFVKDKSYTASQDYESFQMLFRTADSLEEEECNAEYKDTSEFDRIAEERKMSTIDEALKRIPVHENDIVHLRSKRVVKYIAPSIPRKMRRVRQYPTSAVPQLPLLSFAWEDQIQYENVPLPKELLDIHLHRRIVSVMDHSWVYDVIWDEEEVFAEERTSIDLIPYDDTVLFRPPSPTRKATTQEHYLNISAPAELPTATSHMNAEELAKHEKLTRLEQEKLERLRSITSAGFDVAAQAMEDIAAINRKQRDESLKTTIVIPKRRVLSAIASLEHSNIALTHQCTKTVLTNVELRHFHRPRLSIPTLRNRWHLAIEKKGSHNKVSSRATQLRNASVPQINTLSDLSLLDGEYIMLEYIEEHPPVMLNMGMASKIVNYYRTAIREEEQEEKTNEEGSAESTAVTPAAPTQRLPRYLQRLGSSSTKRAKRSITAISNIDIPKLSEGVTEVLDSGETFPLMGDIMPDEIQPCFLSNLFLAPLFNHKPQYTDFLMVRYPRRGYQFLVRALPPGGLFTVGQIEPQQIVVRPGRKKSMPPIMYNFVLLQLYRFFVRSGDIELDVRDIEREFNYFSSRYKTEFRKCMRTFADEYEGGIWRRKAYIANEYEKLISLEDVCCFQKSISYHHNLTVLGITLLMDLNKIEQSLSLLQKLRNFRIEREKKIESNYRMRNTPAIQRLLKILAFDIERIKKCIDTGRFIYEQLLLAPWNLTENFVKVHIERSGTGQLQLTGVPGDPSGVGEGFSFLKAAKTTEANKGTALIVNTDRDLRKLNAKEAEAVLLQMGLDVTTLKKLKRWDRIHLIREMANKAAEAGISEGLHKFARESKVTQQMQLEEYTKKCLTIWQRQAASLSCPVPPEYNDDDDDDDYLDDLEKGVEEAHESRRGEENEADEIEEIKSVLDKPSRPAPAPSAEALGVTFSVGGADDSDTNASDGPFAHRIRPQKVVKRTIRRVKQDGTETIEVQYIVSDAEVSRVNNLPKPKKKNLPPVKPEEFGTDGPDGQVTLKLGSYKNKAQAALSEKQRQEAMHGDDSHPYKHRKRSSNIKRNMRLPHVLFASTLEQLLMEIWIKPYVYDFIYPVDTKIYTNYLQFVSHPICLSDIRDNICKYKYMTLDSFISDVKLVATNCERFNGANAQLTRNAKKMVSVVQELVKAEKSALGEGNDKFSIQERDIKAKFATIHRPLSSKPNKPATPPAASMLAAPSSKPSNLIPKKSQTLSSPALSAPKPTSAQPVPKSLPTPAPAQVRAVDEPEDEFHLINLSEEEPDLGGLFDGLSDEDLAM